MRRSAGTRLIPRRAAAVGEAGAPRPSANLISPARRATGPEQDAEQRRHAGSLEAGEADDLARSGLERDVAQLVVDGQALDGEAGGGAAAAPAAAGRDARVGNSSAGDVPTIASTIRDMVAAARSTVVTMAPLRITVIRSAIWNTSSSRCDT